MVQNVIRFFQEAYQELKLSSWLTKEQMMGSTLVVIVLTVIVAIFVGAVDRVLVFLASILLRVR
jgi:preprotein translocase SecE subunit